MTLQIAFACFALFFAQNAVSGFLPQSADTKETSAAFSLAGVGYFHRFTKDDLHEYTPSGQSDFKTWTDMMTINVYRSAKNGDALAATANGVLETYKANKAVVVKTDSVPRRGAKPAEHLIVVLFARPEFIEVAFSRFRMNEGVGSAVTYSHRVYGKKAGDEMNAWLKTNGSATEKNLMTWDAMPKLSSPK